MTNIPNCTAYGISYGLSHYHYRGTPPVPNVSPSRGYSFDSNNEPPSGYLPYSNPAYNRVRKQGLDVALQKHSIDNLV